MEGYVISTKKIRKTFFVSFFIIFSVTTPLYASFIESTIGTAVVNDATATFYNPAALTLLKNTQAIGQGSTAHLNSHFKGQVTQVATGLTQTGDSSTRTHYYLPEFYLGVPVNQKMTVGLAVISNSFGSNIDDNSILRYAQSNNHTDDVDIVPAIGIRLNEYLSVGAGINFSHANFLTQPTIGFPSLGIPDTQSRNETTARALGGDVGILVKPCPKTLIGFNYRSAVTYHLTGTSQLNSQPPLATNLYHFTFWTPARSVLSISQAVTPKLGLIGTVQYIQWSIFHDIEIKGIATQIGPTPGITNADIPYHFRDAWIFTAGNQYRITPKWVIRFATSYMQSPSSGHFQISQGDSIIVGGSTGYEVNKFITLDGSYAHAFMQNEDINIINRRNIINGVNSGSRDSVSLKLTFNV